MLRNRMQRQNDGVSEEMVIVRHSIFTSALRSSSFIKSGVDLCGR